MSAFEILNKINVNGHTEKKNGLTYLSWAWAWAEVKKAFPEATYTIYESGDGWNYFTDGHTCWVKTGVTIDGLEMVEYLPIMDFKNKSIMLENVTSMDVNKAIQRSLTKACARHGLGLYIYAGEDLPEGDDTKPEKAQIGAHRDANADAVELAKVRSKVLKFVNDNKMDATKVGAICKHYKVSSINEMSAEDCKNYLAQIELAKKKEETDGKN